MGTESVFQAGATDGEAGPGEGPAAPSVVMGVGVGFMTGMIVVMGSMVPGVIVIVGLRGAFMGVGVLVLVGVLMGMLVGVLVSVRRSVGVGVLVIVGVDMVMGVQMLVLMVAFHLDLLPWGIGEKWESELSISL